MYVYPHLTCIDPFFHFLCHCPRLTAIQDCRKNQCPHYPFFRVHSSIKMGLKKIKVHSSIKISIMLSGLVSVALGKQNSLVAANFFLEIVNSFTEFKACLVYLRV